MLMNILHGDAGKVLYQLLPVGVMLEVIHGGVIKEGLHGGLPPVCCQLVHDPLGLCWVGVGIDHGLCTLLSSQGLHNSAM